MRLYSRVNLTIDGFEIGMVEKTTFFFKIWNKLNLFYLM